MPMRVSSYLANRIPGEWLRGRRNSDKSRAGRHTCKPQTVREFDKPTCSGATNLSCCPARFSVLPGDLSITASVELFWHDGIPQP